MDINNQIGETAGKVWHALSSAGPQTLAQLKKKVNGSSELLSLPWDGWLVRIRSRSSRTSGVFGFN
jgi:hypothetical protein